MTGCPRSWKSPAARRGMSSTSRSWRAIPGHQEDQARRCQPALLPPGQVAEQSRLLLLLPGPHPIGRALQELEVLLHHDGRDRHPVDRSPGDVCLDSGRQHRARSVRDLPSGIDRRRLMGLRRCPRRPVTAYVYDWNLLPIGQLMWMKELESYAEFPPLQDRGELQPLSQVMDQVKKPDGRPEPINGRTGMDDNNGGRLENGPPVSLEIPISYGCSQFIGSVVKRAGRLSRGDPRIHQRTKTFRKTKQQTNTKT